MKLCWGAFMRTGGELKNRGTSEAKRNPSIFYYVFFRQCPFHIYVYFVLRRFANVFYSTKPCLYYLVCRNKQCGAVSPFLQEIV